MSSYPTPNGKHRSVCHIPEDDTLHNHRCENLKSYIVSLYNIKMDFIERRCENVEWTHLAQGPITGVYT
jgi:hypothetical protein